MTPAEVVRALAARPSVRSFDGRPVAPELIDQLVEPARWTGSARNRQPWRFLAVDDAPTLRSLATLGAYAQHVATAPCAIVILSADNGMRDTEFDVGRVAQTLSLAAAALGLGCCLATIYPDDNVTRAAALLRVADGWLPRHVLSIGHPGPRPTGRRAIPGGRLDPDELLTRHRP